MPFIRDRTASATVALFDPFHFPRGGLLSNLIDDDHWMKNETSIQDRNLTSYNAFDFDLVEREKEYHLRADLPGFAKKDIAIKLEEGLLTISSERQAEESSEKDNFIHKRRFLGKISRSIRLPKDVNEEEVAASYENGVLALTIAKKEPAIKTKTISLA